MSIQIYVKICTVICTHHRDTSKKDQNILVFLVLLVFIASPVNPLARQRCYRSETCYQGVLPGIKRGNETCYRVNTPNLYSEGVCGTPFVIIQMSSQLEHVYHFPIVLLAAVCHSSTQTRTQTMATLAFMVARLVSAGGGWWLSCVGWWRLSDASRSTVPTVAAAGSEVALLHRGGAGAARRERPPDCSRAWYPSCCWVRLCRGVSTNSKLLGTVHDGLKISDVTYLPQ